MADIVDGETPEEINPTIWRKLMRTYKNDPSQIDGSTASLAETTPADGMVSCFIIVPFHHNCTGGASLFLYHQEAV